jgi:hypothetical protein
MPHDPRPTTPRPIARNGAPLVVRRLPTYEDPRHPLPPGSDERELYDLFDALACTDERYLRGGVEIRCDGVRYVAFIGDDGGRPGKGEHTIVLRVADDSEAWSFDEVELSELSFVLD